MKKEHLLLWFATWLPFILLLLIIFFFYGVYVDTYLYPLIKQDYQTKPLMPTNAILLQLVQINDYMFSNKVIALTSILHILLFLLIITLIRVVITPPGYVPKEWLKRVNDEINSYIQNEEHLMNNKKGSQTSTSFSSELDEEQRIQLNIRAKMELIEKQGKRFCKNCSNFKPKRTHHCRQCRACWLKMDHHCQWLNNCIGFGNYKLFINLLQYGWALLGFIVITYSRCYYDTLSTNSSDLQLFLVSFTFLFSIVLWILLSAFTLFHIWAITENITTLEYCENKPRNTLPQNSIKNFTEVFGYNVIYWFLPIQPNIQMVLE